MPCLCLIIIKSRNVKNFCWIPASLKGLQQKCIVIVVSKNCLILHPSLKCSSYPQLLLLQTWLTITSGLLLATQSPNPSLLFSWEAGTPAQKYLLWFHFPLSLSLIIRIKKGHLLPQPLILYKSNFPSTMFCTAQDVHFVMLNSEIQ